MPTRKRPLQTAGFDLLTERTSGWSDTNRNGKLRGKNSEREDQMDCWPTVYVIGSGLRILLNLRKSSAYAIRLSRASENRHLRGSATIGLQRR
jgi:hypothetical protein